MRPLFVKVAGVTFEGRQAFLAELTAGDPVQLRPEPSNTFDPNAIAVFAVTRQGATYQIGYVPKELAADVSQVLGGETLTGKVYTILGGFMAADGSMASLGCLVQVDIPEEEGYES